MFHLSESTYHTLNWAEIVKDKETWIIGIKCLDCGLVSYNPIDVEEKYCSNCDAYHSLEQVKIWNGVSVDDIKWYIWWILVDEMEGWQNY